MITNHLLNGMILQVGSMKMVYLPTNLPSKSTIHAGDPCILQVRFLTARTWKWMVGILLSFWGGLFSWAMYPPSNDPFYPCTSHPPTGLDHDSQGIDQANRRIFLDTGYGHATRFFKWVFGEDSKTVGMEWKLIQKTYPCIHKYI